ncbi:glycosyltransferase [Sabulibacter ruber]|uniref:glycosyltransferase n=1 Tax=Sabulibacter ruber TaxID=2811901 RepID=UPI003100C81F
MIYWLLTTEYPPFYGGGISTYCKYTSEMLHSYGHQVTVFVQDFHISSINEEAINGVRVIRFPFWMTKTINFLGYNAALSYEFAEVVRQYIEREGSPDILESQEYSGIAYYLQQFKLLKYPLFEKLNIVITCHAPSFLCLEYNQVPIYQFPEYWTGQMEKATIKSADILISPSKYFVSEAKKRMNWNTIEEAYISNPIGINAYTSDEIPSFEPKKIVCFGKMAPLKGSFELLKYFKSIWDDGHLLQLQIIGGTQQIFHPEGRTMGDLIRKQYQEYINKGLLVLLEEMEPEVARQNVMNAQVVLVPSLFDNLPYTVLEAMSWGKVVLASRQGGQSEVIENGINGFLFDHYTSGDFQEKLLHILNLPNESIKMIGQHARKSILHRFHPDVIYSQKIELINDYLGNKAQHKIFPFIEASNHEVASIITLQSTDNLLSIVIPFYNMGNYIEECVQSVLNSNYPNKEIIIINDGSTESDSLKKLQELTAKYPIQVFTTANNGLPSARNYGASMAKGRYLAFLDADDVVDATYYSKAIRVLGSYENVHFVGCWVQYFEGSTSCWPTFNPEPPYLLLHNMVNSSALVYKKEAFQNGGMNDSALVYGMEDWESVINLIGKGFRGVVLPELLFHYRVRKGSMARSFTQVKRLYLHKYITDKHASLYRKYGVEVAHLLTNNGSSLAFDNPTFRVPDGKLTPLKEKLKERVKHNRLLRKFAYSIYKKIN